jgi:cation:H+ antiporter
MMWLKFLLSAAVLVFAATQLGKYGDIIALRTRWGGMFIGLVLLAAATSLPELFTSISSIELHSPDLAAGNLLGSNAINMFLLAVVEY